MTSESGELSRFALLYCIGYSSLSAPNDQLASKIDTPLCRRN